MGTMPPSWEIAPYFAFIDVHFVLRQAPISLTIAKHGQGVFFVGWLEIKFPISISQISYQLLS